MIGVIAPIGLGILNFTPISFQKPFFKSFPLLLDFFTLNGTSCKPDDWLSGGFSGFHAGPEVKKFMLI